MQPLVGLWQTSEGFTSAACDQTIQQQHTIGLLSVFAVLFCHIKTTFPIGSDSPSPARMGGGVGFHPPLSQWSRAFVASYRRKHAPRKCEMWGWRCIQRRQGVCLGFRQSASAAGCLPGSQPAAEPVQHFKSQQAAHSSTVSHFYQRRYWRQSAFTPLLHLNAASSHFPPTFPSQGFISKVNILLLNLLRERYHQFPCRLKAAQCDGFRITANGCLDYIRFSQCSSGKPPYRLTMQAGHHDSYWCFPPVAADVITAIEEFRGFQKLWMAVTGEGHVILSIPFELCLNTH